MTAGRHGNRRWFGARLVSAGLTAAGLVHAELGRGAARGADDPALVRELAERLLARPRGAGQVLTSVVEIGGRIPQIARATLYPGALPPNLGYEIPIPAGSRVIGSAVGAGPGRELTFMAVLDVPAAAGSVDEYYERALMERGWRAVNLGGLPETRGFVSQRAATAAERARLALEGAALRYYCRGSAGPALRVHVAGETAGIRDVRIDADLPGICAAAPEPRENALPLLRLPPEVEVLGGGGDTTVPGRDGLEGTQAGVRTVMTISELEAIMADQLVAAGWMRRHGERFGIFAWSTWALAGPPERRGFLTVTAEPEQDIRVLRFQVRVI